jgi:TolB-like protein
VGLDPQATDRLTLEAAPAGEGQLKQDWCLWLDPRFVAPLAATAPRLLCVGTAERLADAISQALGETRIDGLAVAYFTVANFPADQHFTKDLGQDLLVLLGRKFRVAGVYAKQLDVGAPLPDANRNELQKMAAAYVLTGSVSGRAEGTILNACVVQVDNGALIASATVQE